MPFNTQSRSNTPANDPEASLGGPNRTLSSLVQDTIAMGCNVHRDQSLRVGDNLNRLAIYVRGKLAQEDVPAQFSERGVYASYLIGELRVDSCDLDDQPNVATRNRQQIVEGDQRFQELKTFLQGEL